MSALSILAELNDRLELATRAAEDLEREIDSSLPQRRIHTERSGPAGPAKRRLQSGAERVLGAPQETFDVGPGAYDVASTAVGKRVTGGKWGDNKRFCDRKGEEEHGHTVGPGQYDPNQSFVAKKRTAVKIVAPTKKTLAAHLHAFEREEADRGVGPGKYSPSFFASSQWSAIPRVSISKNHTPDAKLQQHILERNELVAGQAPGAYDCWARAELSSCAGAVQWRRNYAPQREKEMLPGPGSYDPDYSAVKGHVSEVRIAPSEAGSRTDRSFASERSTFLQNADGPGPGTYDAQHDYVHPRAPGAVIKKHEAKSLKLPARHEGDMLVLNPRDSYTKPNVRCSVVMKEASFASQASTVLADESQSELGSVYDVDLSILSTKPRSSCFSMDGQTKRQEVKQPHQIGPGHYELNYDATEPHARATRVLQSNAKRESFCSEKELEKVGSSSCKLILYPNKTDDYMRSSIGAPDIGRYSARPRTIPGQISSDFTGEEDYDTIAAARAMWTHTPGINMAKESMRDEVENDSNPAMGPGKYNVDDSLVHPRTQAAFISSTVMREREDDHDGDTLELEPTAADSLVRKRLPAPVNMGKAMGRMEPKKEAAPEALDYVADQRANTKPGEAIPGVVSLKFDGQVGRVDLNTEGEGAHLLGKYVLDYSQVEVQAPAVDFSRGSARHAEGEEESEDKRDGDVLLLDTEKAHNYMRRSSKLVLDLSKQSSRPDEVAGQLISDFTGENDYEAVEAARTLHAHTPTLSIGKVSERKDLLTPKEANPKIGPGTYDTDDALVHPRVRSAFISTAAAHEPEVDLEGDELDLDTTTAENLVRGRVPAIVDMAKSLGRLEPKIERGPEALDYVSDSRDRVAAGEAIPGVATIAFDGQIGRIDVLADGEASQLQGTYDADYSLVEKKVVAADFGKPSGRVREGHDDDHQDVQDGDILVLEPERGYEYLRRTKLVVDIAKQTGRPDEVAGQHVSECDPALEYAPNYDALLPHTPEVVFDKMVGRKEDKTDEDAERLGPGSYNVDDHLTHARVPTAAFGLPSPVEDDSYVDRLEGDILDLYPEHADMMTRPVVKGFTNVFQKPALDTEWATATHSVQAPDGSTVTIPSIRKRVNWHRLSELVR